MSIRSVCKIILVMSVVFTIPAFAQEMNWNDPNREGGVYINTRPSKSSVQNICRKISEQTTAARFRAMEPERMVERLNRILSGWSNYFRLGQVSPAYAAIDAHTNKRLRQWLCRKGKVRSRKYVRFCDERLYEFYGLTRLPIKTKSLPWA